MRKLNMYIYKKGYLSYDSICKKLKKKSETRTIDKTRLIKLD